MATRLHRQSAEVGAIEAAHSDLDIRLQRFAVEVLGDEPDLITPEAVPAELELFFNNWVQRVEISTSWSTEIKSSQAEVAEDRRGFLERPQRTLTFQWAGLDKEGTDRLIPAVKRLANEEIQVPLYSGETALTASISGSPSTTLFCNTVDRRFYAGGRIAIAELTGNRFTGDYTTRVIVETLNDRIIVDSGVSNVNAGRTSIFPLLSVRILLEPSIDFLSNHVVRANLTVDEVFGPNTLGPFESGLPGGFQVFQGAPIFNFEPDWSSEVPVTLRREGAIVQSGHSSITETRGARQRYVLGYNLLFQRPEAIKFMRFFDTRMGALLAFWQVDQEDLWTVDSQSNGDLEVNIEALGNFNRFVEELDFLGIVMLDGTVHLEAVANIDDEGATWEVTLASAFPSINLGQIRRVARARLVRFEKDSITERWETLNVCTMETSTVELIDEIEVTL